MFLPHNIYSVVVVASLLPYSLSKLFLSYTACQHLVLCCITVSKQENLWFIKNGPLQAGVNL